MKTKSILITAFVIVAGIILAVILNMNRPPAPVASPTPATPTAKAPVAVSEPATPAPAPVVPPDVQPTKRKVQPVQKPDEIVAQSVAPQAPVDEPHSDQVARVALSLVGTGDREAEAYWLDAIYDTSLSDQERQDLMEDLNEDGLSDPQHPGPQDLPLILNRLRLIEEIAPYANDFMLRHLGEAYKDLNDMLAGRPVQ